MKTQIEGVVTLKNEKGVLVAIIYKDGSNAPVVYLTGVASVEEVVELMGGTLTNNISK